jgi:hypothetical protein
VKVVGFGSVRGAPGVTTTATLIAGALPDPAVLVEADLAGSVMAVRYELGREPGLTTLAASGSLEPNGWREHAQDAGGVPVLVGPDSPGSARSLWRRAGTGLGQTLTSSDATAVADLGRLDDETPLLDQLSLLVLLVRPVAEHLVTLSHRLPMLRNQTQRVQVGVVLVGEGTYRPVDVAGPLGVDVLGVLPNDPRAAEALYGGGTGLSLARSRLFRAATGVAATIHTAIGTYDEPVGASR